jgi:hypothetical protein
MGNRTLVGVAFRRGPLSDVLCEAGQDEYPRRIVRFLVLDVRDNISYWAVTYSWDDPTTSL